MGVAGLGEIGRVHAANIVGLSGARLVMVADTSPAAREEASQVFEVPSSEAYLDLVGSPEVDAVVIASPPSAHAEMVELAAAARKHVLCEKPLALAIGDAQRAVSAAARAGVVLQVGFHRRFDRDFMLAKSRIGQGELGKIYTFLDSMRDLEPPSPGAIEGPEQALLHDATCHDLDAARWLVGEIDEITTFGATLASESLREIGQVDHAITVLRFESGALGVIDESLTGGFARTRTFLDRFTDAYPRELAAFTNAIRHGSEAAVTGEDGLAAVVLATAAQRSLETKASVRLRREQSEGRLRYAIDKPVA